MKPHHYSNLGLLIGLLIVFSVSIAIALGVL
jgi:hypothetical protein